jgi:hypothetical protein
MWITKGYFDTFVSILDARVSKLEDEIQILKDWLAEERAEKEEFKHLLFTQMGIVKEINNIPKEMPKPIEAPKSWARRKAELEQAEKEKAWAAKSAENTKPVEDSKDAVTIPSSI